MIYKAKKLNIGSIYIIIMLNFEKLPVYKENIIMNKKSFFKNNKTLKHMNIELRKHV